jgi:hypothetical protein
LSACATRGGTCKSSWRRGSATRLGADDRWGQASTTAGSSSTRRHLLSLRVARSSCLLWCLLLLQRYVLHLSGCRRLGLRRQLRVARSSCLLWCLLLLQRYVLHLSGCRRLGLRALALSPVIDCLLLLLGGPCEQVLHGGQQRPVVVQ